MDDNLFENILKDTINTDIIFNFLNDVVHSNFSIKRKYRDRKFHKYHQYDVFEISMGVCVSRILKKILEHGGQRI